MLDLYKNIKELRIANKMTQTELAEKTGYSDKSMIAKIEKGVVDLPQSKIEAFSMALGVSPGYLMGWDGCSDSLSSPAAPPELSGAEIEHMRKYRYLDTYGRDFVDDVLNREYDRCASERGNLSSSSDMAG